MEFWLKTWPHVCLGAVRPGGVTLRSIRMRESPRQERTVIMCNVDYWTIVCWWNMPHSLASPFYKVRLIASFT